MRLRRFTNVPAFYQEVQDFLLQREAENNLILGILFETRHYSGRMVEPYLAVVKFDDTIIAIAIRTPPFSVLLSHQTCDGAIPLIAQDIHTLYGDIPGVNGITEHSKSFADYWHELTGRDYRQHLGMGIYKLTAVNPIHGVSGHIRRATDADREWVIEWFLAFGQEAIGESDRTQAEGSVSRFMDYETRGLYFWEDQGKVVSMAGYGGMTPHGMRVSAVYTPPEYRRRGYASALVAELSQHLLNQGRRFCFLYTDLANPTSNHIYQIIGYQHVCDATDYRFILE